MEAMCCDPSPDLVFVGFGKNCLPTFKKKLYKLKKKKGCSYFFPLDTDYVNFA